MQFTLLIQTLFVLVTFTNASAIPYRRVRSWSKADIRSSVHDRHRRLSLSLRQADPVSASSSVSPTTYISASAVASTSTSTVTSASPSVITLTNVLPSVSSRTSDSTSIPTQSSSSGTPKYVVAHHMVGNTFPYTVQDWADDIALAHASGIDGFALNMGSDDWEPARVSDAYQAALQSGLDFKLFMSLDMTSLPCASTSDAQQLRSYVTAHASHPNQLLYNSRAFVSTFAGESCQFGQSSVAEGWKSQFTQHSEIQSTANGNGIFFVPSFFVDPSTFSQFDGVMDGDFNWNSGWPIQVTTDFAANLLTSNSSLPAGITNLLNVGVDSVSLPTTLSTELASALSQFIGSTDSDQQHLAALAQSGIGARDGNGTDSKAYMAAVSPWFFTHYSPETFNKNFMYLSDQHLYSKRWESLIASRDQFDIVEILTWNDYGESDYVGPIKGSQPNSQAWVDGLNHTGWLDLTKYYAAAFKTGSYPTVEKDEIIMWARPHFAMAQAPDSVGPPSNFQLSEDTLWAVVMTKAPSTVTLAVSSSTNQTFSVPAGLTKLSVPLTPGNTMHGTIERDGQVVVDLHPDTFSFEGSPQTYNFNAFVANAIAA